MRQIEVARRLHQNPETIAPAHHRERRFGGAEHAHAVIERRRRGELARKAFGRVLVGARDDQAREPPERRIAGLLAQLDLGVIEGVAVAGDQRAHHRMLGLMRLQKALPLPRLAAGAAGDLMQKLKRALGRARIAIPQAEIGIDDADEVELREMMALGDQLGADDDVEVAFGNAVEFLAQPLDRFHQVAGEHDDPRVRKQLRDLFLQALDAGPTGANESCASHFGQCRGGGIEKPQW